MSTHGAMLIRPFEPGDRNAVIQLWRDCGLVVPWNDPDQDIDRKIAFQPELFLVGVIDATVVATTVAGYDGHRGWLYSVAVSPDYRRQGLGRQIVMRAIDRLLELGCHKVNLQVRTSNLEVIAFYQRIGFRTDEVVGMGMRLNESRAGDE